MKLKQETQIALGIIAFIYVVYTVVKTFFFLNQSISFHVITSLGSLVFIVVFGYLVRAIDIYLDSVYTFERNPVTRIFIQFLVTMAVLTLIRVVPYFLFYDKIPIHPSSEIIAATYAINIFMVLSVILSIFGYHFFVRWKQEKIVAAELEKEKGMVQYDNLKNQLNPHFLFNSLTSLNSLIFENPQLASDFLQQLSKVYRYVLDHKEKNLVTLDTEVNFVKHYVQLLKTRFEQGLDVTFEIAEPALQKAIVPVTLQILIENALKHNTTGKDTPLIIRIFSMNNYLVIENNVQLKSMMDDSNRQGLGNLKNLYRYLSDKEIDITATDLFVVKIPLLEF